jgi:phospholipid/cholesterol/gamma-HCH transport system permease protein
MSSPEFDLIEGERRSLVLRGDWTISRIGKIDARLRALAASGEGEVDVDVSGLGALDTAGAFVIDRTVQALSVAKATYRGASDEALSLLEQAREVAARKDDEPQDAEVGHGFVDMMERIGRSVVHGLEEAAATLSFFGATVVSVGRVVTRPAKMRWTALVSVMEDSGLDAVPIVAFLSFFVGMVMAFIGATSLAALGASIFVVESVGFGLLRELSGVLVAIIIAGRTNSAFTAQIGAMKMRQEVDAMTTLGLDPMDTIVAPRVLAMVIMLPVLTFVGMLAGLGGAIAVCGLVLDISPTVFFNRMQEFVPISQFWIGMSKAPIFGLAIALIGCRQGLLVGGSVQSLGEHTTRSVVQAIFAIIVIDAVFAIIYMEMGV